MLKTRLMTAAAAVALFAAPAAFAQEIPVPQPTTPAQDPAQTPPTLPPTTPTDGTTTAPAPTGAPTAATASQAQENSVVAVLRADGRFTTLLSALDAAGLTAVLEAQPAVSIFAPTDEAFAAVPEAERTRLMDPANREELRALLLYHVIAADVQSSQITGARGGVPTAGGAQVQLDGTGDAIKVDSATVVQADIDASNGAVFAIDKVLMPSASQAAMGDEQAVTPAEPSATEPAMPAEPTGEATPPAQPMAEGQEASPATAEPTADDGVAAAPPAGEGDPLEDGEPTDPQA
ncbi:MAG: fasciclin domain-containing protein [Alphaproteobacteria bacterium]|nr:fasciclin domain-containing protein [Alphaproteobacteria bacterium]MBU1525425.1 fasciclin domain-containing protein [Alphaproteobacteria bacterium]MBU2351122.1 fasciclin domain-containing protein [Alphaproteobacteria bacterium]MBU2382826.1 fasciclin domain-containing protein [Alphaproteobacteria bacterium]